MAACIFCRIVAKEIPAHVIHEDRDTIAFLDVNPLTTGHTLFVPKRHAERLADLAPEEAASHLRTLPRVVSAVVAGVAGGGATVAWNDGPAAGQEVAHVHCHIIPRATGDRFGPIHAMFKGPKPTADVAEVAKKIRDSLP